MSGQKDQHPIGPLKDLPTSPQNCGPTLKGTHNVDDGHSNQIITIDS